MLFVLAAAQAATVTDLPPFLRGDVTIGYTFDRLQGSLVERGSSGDPDAEVGKRQVNDHSLHYGAAFGVAPGAAVFVDVQHTVYRSVEAQEWSKMVYDPSTESGTYVGTANEADETVARGAGLQGVWIGAEGTPFSQAFVKRHNRVTLLLQGAVRTPTEQSWFTVADPSTTGGLGMRGVGPGGVGLRIGGAASITQGRNEPYLSMVYEDNLPTTIDITADDGTLLWRNCEIDPANRFEAKVGTEVVLGSNEASGARSAFDVHLATGWTSFQDIPTGVELPAVLLPEAGLVQQSETLEMGGGLGLDLRFMKYLALNLHADARYHFPQRLESPYPVYTGPDTLHVMAGVDVQIRVR